MPLLRLTVRPGRDDATRRALADAAYEVMVRTLKAPENDRFQVVTARDDSAFIADPTYLGMDRRDPVMIELTLRRGRTDEQKRAFYAGLAEAFAPLGVKPDDLIVVLTENEAIDWSFGRGIASYSPAAAGA